MSQPARRGDRPVLDQGDARALISALGGFRGLTDSGLPGVVFGFSYLFWGLSPALRAALAAGALLLVVRLVRRQTVQYAGTGFLLVGVAALLARQTGNAADFYLPGFFTTGGLAAVFAVSALARYPAVGLVLGPLLGEDLAWRLDPPRLRAYTMATWVWVGGFLFKIVVQLPLYLAGLVTALGAVRFAMGWPVALLAGWVTWAIVRRVEVTRPAGRAGADPADTGPAEPGPVRADGGGTAGPRAPAPPPPR